MSLDRERGFIVIHRQIQSSPVFKTLTAEQRSVLLSILLLANWGPDRFLYGTEWVEVTRGELAHSLETIAKHAGVSIKVVRTTVAKLTAGQFLGTRTGTPSGTGPRILIVLNYSKYQDAPGIAGTPSGTGAGTAGARVGHGTGTPGAPREPDQPEEPNYYDAPAANFSPAFNRESVLAKQYPATAAVLGRLADQGVVMSYAQKTETRAKVETAIARTTVDLAVSAVFESFKENRRTSIGWHLDAIEAASRKPRLVASAPDTEWLDPLPPEARVEWQEFIDRRLPAFWPDKRAAAADGFRAHLIDRYTNPSADVAPY